MVTGTNLKNSNSTLALPLAFWNRGEPEKGSQKFRQELIWVRSVSVCVTQRKPRVRIAKTSGNGSCKKNSNTLYFKQRCQQRNQALIILATFDVGTLLMPRTGIIVLCSNVEQNSTKISSFTSTILCYANSS